MGATYDRIGAGYALQRRPDPRIAARVEAALGGARTIVNVGAGTGSYEPMGREVVAVEPSLTMIEQRPPDAARAIQANAEALPFADASFDAAMAVLTIHHWRDQAAGLREMRRVARERVVILTFDPAHRGCWLTDYFPQLSALDEAQMPKLAFYGDVLGEIEVATLPIPADCTDGFLYAFWRRPEAYLDPQVRSGSSSFWKMDDIEQGLTALAADLDSGEWERRYGALLDLNELDAGYRLIVAGT